MPIRGTTRRHDRARHTLTATRTYAGGLVAPWTLPLPLLELLPLIRLLISRTVVGPHLLPEGDSRPPVSKALRCRSCTLAPPSSARGLHGGTTLVARVTPTSHTPRYRWHAHNRKSTPSADALRNLTGSFIGDVERMIRSNDDIGPIARAALLCERTQPTATLRGDVPGVGVPPIWLGGRGRHKVKTPTSSRSPIVTPVPSASR